MWIEEINRSRLGLIPKVLFQLGLTAQGDTLTGLSNRSPAGSSVAAIVGTCLSLRELTQVSFLSRQKKKIGAANACLLRQKYACRDKTFVATNIYGDKHNFVATNTWSFASLVTLLGFIYLLFARMPRDNYNRRFRSMRLL